jgi:antitoxin component YwqK of YwqJK toxin-antitoxin module
MKYGTIILQILLCCQFTVKAQESLTDKTYFNRFFELEPEISRHRYYGYPKKKMDNFYTVTLYSLKGIKVADVVYRKNLSNKQGTTLVYDSAGKLRLKTHFDENFTSGTVETWFANGNKADSGSAARNMHVGIWKTWYENGQLKEYKTYTAKPFYNGPAYHGAPIIINNVVLLGELVTSNSLEKEYKSYFENGLLKDSGYYNKNGLRSGIWQEWGNNNTIRMIGFYRKGWKTGAWKYYDTKGKLLFVIHYSRRKYGAGQFIPINRTE